jgi:hypothetical protein
VAALLAALAGLLRLLAGVLSATLLAGLLLARIGLILLTRLLDRDCSCGAPLFELHLLSHGYEHRDYNDKN